METEARPRAWEEMAQKGDLAGAVEEYVRHHGSAIMVEVEKLLAPYIPIRGTLVWCAGNKNFIMWGAMSPEFGAVMQECYRRKRIRAHASSVLCYLCDGAVLSLPLAKRPPKGGYKTPHWAPIELHPEPFRAT